jgi:hypothetical protein
MATNVNYSSLVTDISNFLERGGSVITDPTVFEQIPRIINAAERDCAQLLKLLGQIESLTSAPPTGGFQANVAVVTKPDRWRQTISINYGTGLGNATRTFLYPRALEYCTAYWPSRATSDPANPPAFYAEYDYQHWLISPTPDQAYPFEALCYMQPAFLDDVNQNNFWTEYTPNLLLYTALRMAAVFLKNDERIQTFANEQKLQLDSLDAQDLQRILDRAAERRRP